MINDKYSQKLILIKDISREKFKENKQIENSFLSSEDSSGWDAFLYFVRFAFSQFRPVEKDRCVGDAGTVAEWKNAWNNLT